MKIYFDYKKFFLFLKKNKIYLFLTVSFFCLGSVLFFVKRNWLLIHWVPGYAKSKNASDRLRQKISPKKDIKCFYWKDDRLCSESVSCVLRSNKAESIKLIVSSWLSLLYEERVLEKIVEIESVALGSSEQMVYLSFDKNILKREWSIQKKWRVLSGLCKTIMESELGIQNIIFLVGHQSMVDDHLDFSRPWPVDGFGE